MSERLDDGGPPAPAQPASEAVRPGHAEPRPPAPSGPGPRLAAVTAEEAARRAEHDVLQDRLAARISVDHARRGFVLLFAGLLCVLLSGKLAWDRWGPLAPGVRRETPDGPPVYLYLAVAATAVVLVLALRGFLAARRIAREEDALHARLLALRAALGLDR